MISLIGLAIALVAMGGVGFLLGYGHGYDTGYGDASNAAH
jgi:nitrogen fixation-related uncharacterized protein